ncbi:hypothetical protein [Fortiea contorta]|uniref:hypothetical protein n=1 Tax=Fortiea contorta TaxID=1892405 RepID=UPI00034ACC6B|nr:hypothetical protein [Fortiea contorta]
MGILPLTQDKPSQLQISGSKVEIAIAILVWNENKSEDRIQNSASRVRLSNA